jgi:hypothetical protein
MVRFSLPTYAIIKREGYSDGEITKFIEFLKNNAHLIYRYAEDGGVNIA